MDIPGMQRGNLYDTIDHTPAGLNPIDNRFDTPRSCGRVPGVILPLNELRLRRFCCGCREVDSMGGILFSL